MNGMESMIFEAENLSCGHYFSVFPKRQHDFPVNSDNWAHLKNWTEGGNLKERKDV
jgi:hypothetical protein